MQNYVQKGETVTVLPPFDVTSDSGLLMGSKFGVAAYSAVANQPLEMRTVGVFNLAKDASTW